jgi:hypothetical protein
MATIGEGQPQALRSQVQPAYLGTGDPGYSGGGTVMASDPQSMMSNYENIFGPAVRDIKWDEQRHKRHQRWHLPDALKGTNSFLTDRVDGLITDATSSPFTKNILPYMYMDQPDKKIKWNVYSFDEGIASRVPYEAAARVLPQSKRSFAGYAVRQGLAIAMEHNFMMSPQGMDNFRKQLMQLVGSIQLTNDLDVHMALLYAPSYQKHMDEKYFDTSRSVNQNCRMYVDLFGFVQKNENALDYLIEDAKNHLTAWGSKPPTFMLCNGSLTRQLTMTPEKTNYITAGPDGKRKLAQGPDLPSYRGVSIINTRQFSLEAGTAPRDMLRRRVRVCEHYRIPWEPKNLLKRYEFYDQSRDSMFYLSWHTLWKASFPPTAPDLHAFFENLREEHTGLRPAQMGPSRHCTFKDWHDRRRINASAWLSSEERSLARMMGIFGYTDSQNYIKFERDLDFVVEINNDDKPRMKMVSFKTQKVNDEALYYCYYLILLKLFVRENFSNITHSREEETELQYKEMVERVLQDLCCTTPMTTPEVLRIINVFIDDQARPAAGAGMPGQDGGDGAGMQAGDGNGGNGAGADGMPNAAGDGARNAAPLSQKRQKMRECEEEMNAYLNEAKEAHNVSHFMYNLQKAGQKCLEIQNIYRDAHKQALTEADAEATRNALRQNPPVFCDMDLVVFRQHTFSKEDNVKCIASDLLLLRPCIEHYMLGVILGRGGGPEDLGATFWGQTELSCYDDAQHGIWGMSYKYHERAIVTNERNLIRVYDVCFDGYCGGNDSTILAWSKDNLEDFKAKSSGLLDAYTGPSMVVMSLPPTEEYMRFPNPFILHTKVHSAPTTMPDRALRSNNTYEHAPFLQPEGRTPTLQAGVYGYYYHAAGMDQWQQNHQAPGHLAYNNETDPYMYSFQGHMATILDGQREETQGSGHLGPNFVGVASVREGRGMMPRGMPSLAHLV